MAQARPPGGAMASDTTAGDSGGIGTPAGKGGLLLEPTLPGLAARLGVRLLSRPRQFGKLLVAARHRDVSEALRRDLDFVIAPVNAGRIDEVNGPFILGMDRSGPLTLERRALYTALAEVDLDALMADAAARADGLLSLAADGIDAVAGYARLVAGGTAQALFGVRGPDAATYNDVARAVFAHTFLNLGGDKAVEARAVRASALMRAWLSAEIALRRTSGALGDDLMGGLLRQPELDDDAVRRILGGMLVGAVDTTASSVARILFVLDCDRRLLAAVERDLGDDEALLGWCRECLRRWPHNPILLRQAAADTTLGGAPVAAGSQVVLWTQAAMQDEEAFPDPGQLRPDRPASAYLHFGGGLHPCAGRAVNDRQIPMLVAKILARGLGKAGPVGWAGAFPANLPVAFRSAR